VLTEPNRVVHSGVAAAASYADVAVRPAAAAAGHLAENGKTVPLKLSKYLDKNALHNYEEQFVDSA